MRPAKKKTEIELETGVSNKRRAAWATKAIASYEKEVKGGDLETDILDLIADLFHLAEAAGFDPDSIYRRAWNHYEYESGLKKKGK